MAERRSLTERLEKLPPGRHLIPRDYVAQNQRERMLAAITEMVGENGYQKTTIESIGKTARVALSTFYEQFSSKEECFLAAFDDSVAAAREVFEELIDPEQPWVDQVASALAIFCEMVVSEPARAKLCIVESQAAGSESLARYQAMLESIAPRLREGRQLNPRAGRLPEGIEVAIVGGVLWLVHQRLVTDRVDELGELLPEMIRVTLTPYVGEEEAASTAERAKVRAPAPPAPEGTRSAGS